MASDSNCIVPPLLKPVDIRSVPDGVDPSPRIFRMLASIFDAKQETRWIGRKLREAAFVLEGKAASTKFGNTAVGRMATRERRVALTTRDWNGNAIPRGVRAGRSTKEELERLSREDESQYQRDAEELTAQGDD